MPNTPTTEDIQRATQRLYAAWELRVPHLTGTSNPYHASKNPANRIDVQVLSWDEMKVRLAGGVDTAAEYRRGFNDAVGQVVVPGRK